MDIVDEIRTNREAGILRLEREYKPKLLAVAARFCPDSQEAEALVYRTMDEVIRCIETLADPDSFFGWMCGIMSNQFGKLNRRKINEKITYTDQFMEMADETIGVDSVVQAVDATLLREAIESLPPKQKEVVLLRYFADMPLTQIARFLMIPVGTVNSRLHMARVVLAMRLGAKLKKSAVAMIAAGLFLLAATAAVVVGGGLMGRGGEAAPYAVGGDGPTAWEGMQATDGTEATAAASVADCVTVPSVPAVPSVSSTSSTKGETEMNIKQKAKAALASAAVVASLAPPVSAGVSSAASATIASFSSFAANSAQTPSALTGGFHSFVSQAIETDTLPQFNSREPRGMRIVIQ